MEDRKTTHNPDIEAQAKACAPDAVQEHEAASDAAGERDTVSPAVEERDATLNAVGERNTVPPAVEERDATLDPAGERDTVPPAVEEHEAVSDAAGERDTVSHAVEERDTASNSAGERDTVSHAVEERDATLDPGPTDDELQDSILEDSNMTSFQKFIARMDDAHWNLAQRLTGMLLGLLAGVALFWDSFSGSEEGFSYSLVVAVLIALVLPNFIERKGLRRIPKLRMAMVITLAIMLVAYFVVTGMRSGFSFRS